MGSDLPTLAQSVTGNVTAIMSLATVTPSSLTPLDVGESGNGISTMVASVGRSALFLLSIISGLLLWLITFATITLPTWLFTLFSMSLTFTMNFTTL